METAVILAGGKSTRIGKNKALLDFGGEPLIGRIYRILKDAFQEVFISANDEETYRFLGAPVIPDVFSGGGSLAGIHAGLMKSTSSHCFFAACDMPFLNVRLIQYLYEVRDEHDIVIPVSGLGYEPLHAFYSRCCLPHIQQQLEAGNLRIIDLFSHLDVREVSRKELQVYDPDDLSYLNLNTLDKFELARKHLQETDK